MLTPATPGNKLRLNSTYLPDHIDVILLCLTKAIEISIIHFRLTYIFAPFLSLHNLVFYQLVVSSKRSVEYFVAPVLT